MLKIINWVLSPNARRLGQVLIQYHKLVILCELVLYSKKNNEKIWLRMPEIWFNPDQRTRFVSWIEESDSLNFQRDVLRMLNAEYGIDLATAKQIHADYVALRKEERKNNKQDFKT